jgi:hypothetical protein
MLRSMSPRWLPLVTGLLPIVAIHLSLVIAINAGSIATCFPYFDGCASISATGRYEPASFVFKPAMIIEAVLMIGYWIFNAAWLRSMARLQEPATPRSTTTMSTIGIIGAVALVIYVTFLGTQTAFYEFMRRFGIYFYFLFTDLAQILLARHALRISTQLGRRSIARISRVQLGLAVAPFLLGALNLLLKSVLDDADSFENAIEWVAALLMHIFFVLTYLSWRETGFEADWKCRMPEN